MHNDKHALWVEKYRPTSIDQYVFQNKQHEVAFKRMIADKSIPQLLLSGVQGTGKTTIAKILINAMDLDPADVIEINASSERGIDTFRNKIENFATSMAMGRFKIVHLEEADKLTPDAQSALKSFMEVVSDHVRFIFTCNHVNKILPPIRSRCQEFFFKAADVVDITETMATILVKEGVKFELDTLDTYVTAAYPDQRKIINLLQQYTVDGQLSASNSAGEAGEWRIKLVDLIAADDWIGARKLTCANVTAEDWEDVYRFLYENLSRAPRFGKKDKWEEAILIVAEHLYKHSIVADPEINAAAMFIRLGQL